MPLFNLKNLGFKPIQVKIFFGLAVISLMVVLWPVFTLVFQRQTDHKKFNFIEIKKAKPTTKQAPPLEVYDLNLATATELNKVGMPPWVTENIIEYRKAGGVFYSVYDLRFISGVTEKVFVESFYYLKVSVSSETHKTHPNQFELNTATAQQLEKVNGIGKVTAQRIINYRNELGGFVSYRQLQEIPKVSARQIKGLQLESYINSKAIKKIPVSSFADSSFKFKHPYLGKQALHHLKKLAQNNQTDTLVFKQIKDLKRLQPYLFF